MSALAYWWNAIGLFLVLAWILQRAFVGKPAFAVIVAVAAILCVVPFFGHAPRYWLSGLTPNISVPLFAVLVLSIWQHAGGKPVFRSREWRAAWIFGAAGAIALYPSALGLGSPGFDSYALGWPWLFWGQSAFFFGALALVCAGLVLRGNRFGWVLVGAAICYLLRVQESHNFWDYLIDPLYAVISLVALLNLGLRRR